MRGSKRGRPLGEHTGARVLLIVTRPDLWNLVRVEANAKNVSLSAAIEEILQDWVAARNVRQANG